MTHRDRADLPRTLDEQADARGPTIRLVSAHMEIDESERIAPASDAIGKSR